MNAVTWLRALWRHRTLVALGAVFAVAIGVLIAFKVTFPPNIQSRQHDVGVASTSALLDTPSSQVVDLGGKSAEAGSTLPGRAALLASLLATSPLKEEIAQRAGIDPRTLIASAPPAGTSTPPKSTAPLATGTTVSLGDPRASTLTIETDVTLPILMVNAESQDVRVATRLANGTIDVLKQHLTDLAGNQQVPARRQLAVKQLGPATAGVVTHGTSPIIGIVAAIFVFGVTCAMILFSTTVAREWRRAAVIEDGDTPDWAELGIVPDLGAHEARPEPQDDNIDERRVHRRAVL